MNKGPLFLFTATFPYGKGESYLEPELEALSAGFSEVHVFPAKKEAYCRRVPSNVVIYDPEMYTMEITSGVTLEFRMFFILFSEFVHSRKKWRFLRSWRYQRSVLKNAFGYASVIRTFLSDSPAVCYSFWMNDWALALAILKKEGVIQNFSFRVNGFDIYDERSQLGFLPFRCFIYSQCSKVFTVSEMARNYIVSRYGFSTKIETAYFGTKDEGAALLKREAPFRIYSNARLIPLKNVVQIARVLSSFDLPVEWMHHGDGEELVRIKDLASGFPSHIKFIHSPSVNDYSEVVKKEKEFAPHVFVSLSTSEGIPVTFLEAISLGIPILSTDVGGCREVLRDGVGILLPSFPADEEVRSALKTILSDSWQNSDRYESIRHFWQEHFSAGRNYPRFVQRLKQEKDVI